MGWTVPWEGKWVPPTPVFLERCDSIGVNGWGCAKDVIPKGLDGDRDALTLRWVGAERRRKEREKERDNAEARRSQRFRREAGDEGMSWGLRNIREVIISVTDMSIVYFYVIRIGGGKLWKSFALETDRSGAIHGARREPKSMKKGFVAHLTAK
jgi:hypothetical protein